MRKKRNKFHILLLIILLLFTVFLVFEFISVFFISPQESQMSAYADSDGWNGISFFSDWVRSEPNYDISNICFSPTALHSVTDAENAVFLIIGPERRYSSEEVDAISDFIERGGSMIVADDSSNANALHDSAAKGSPLRRSVRFHGDALLSLDFVKNPEIVKFEAALPLSPEEERYYSLLFNEGTALNDNPEENEEERLLAISSDYSWLDKNENGEYDHKDGKMQKYDLINMVDFGKSSGLFIADSSIFINDMWLRADNSLFIKDSVRSLIGDNGTVIIDESVHKDSSFLGNSVNFAVGTLGYLCNSIIFIVIFLAVLISLAIVLFARSRKVKRKPHRLEVPTPILIELKNPDLSFSDMYRIRGIIFDLLSLEYDVSSTYLHRHPESIPGLVGEEMINRFLYDPYIYEDRYLDKVVKSCEKRWIEGGVLIRSDIPIKDELTIMEDDMPEVYAEVFPLEEHESPEYNGHLRKPRFSTDEEMYYEAYDEGTLSGELSYDPLGSERSYEQGIYRAMDRDERQERSYEQEIYRGIDRDERQERSTRDHLRGDGSMTFDGEPVTDVRCEKGRKEIKDVPNLVDELFPSQDDPSNKR